MGSFDIQVNLDQTPDLGLVQWMMNCSEIPNCVMDFNQTLNITTNSFNDQMFMSVTFDYLSVNTINLFTATITNIGNSTLENIQIAIWNFTSDTTGNKFTGTIIPGEISLQTTLLPGQVYTFEIQITSSNYNVNLANFTVNANATSLESNQSVQVSGWYSVLIYRVNESAIENWVVLGVFLVVVACIWIFAIVYVRKKYIEFNQFLCLQIKLNQPENAPEARMLMSQNLPKKKPSESEEKSELEDIAGKSLDDLMEKEGIEKPDNK